MLLRRMYHEQVRFPRLLFGLYTYYTVLVPNSGVGQQIASARDDR